MATVFIDFSKLRGSLSAKKIVSKKFADKVGRIVVKAVLEDIARGKSPVKGVGRFVGYKASRATKELRRDLRIAEFRGGKRGKGLRSELRREIKRTGSKSSFYPNSVKDEFPKKKIRPVNLELSGKYLKGIKHRRLRTDILLGFIGLRGLNRKLYEAHNLGKNTKKAVPQRKHWPSKKSDQFTARIKRIIKNLYSRRIKAILKKS